MLVFRADETSMGLDPRTYDLAALGFVTKILECGPLPNIHATASRLKGGRRSFAVDHG
jgi:hypothetical protein